MRKSILFIALTIAVSLQAKVDDISLCGEWRFVADSVDYSPGLPDNAVKVSVPHTYNIMEGLEEYAGKAWYEKKLEIPASMKGQQLRLEFEAVYHDAIVYVNGKKAGSHLGKGYTPFKIDITKLVKYGEENNIVVETNNSYTDLNFPDQRKFDWANDGGIYHKVNLHIIYHNHLLKYISFLHLLEIKVSLLLLNHLYSLSMKKQILLDNEMDN